MLPELWHSYKTDKQLKNMLQNIKNYCDIENAANQLPVKPDQYLLVSFFADNKKGVPYAYYRKMKIIIIAESLKLQTQTDETNIFVSSMWQIKKIIINTWNEHDKILSILTHRVMIKFCYVSSIWQLKNKL